MKTHYWNLRLDVTVPLPDDSCYLTDVYKDILLKYLVKEMTRNNCGEGTFKDVTINGEMGTVKYKSTLLEDK